MYRTEDPPVESRIGTAQVAQPVLRRWRLVLATILLGAAVSAAVVLRTPRLYEASTTLALAGPPPPAGTASASTVRALITTPLALGEAARAAGVDAGSFDREAVFVDPMPNTVFVRLRFRHTDAAAAGRVTEALARAAAERSRQIQLEAGESPTADGPGLNAAKAALREAEQRVLDFRVQSRIELLAAEINAGLRRPGALGTIRKRLSDVDPKVADTLDELYRRELELARLQTEYDVARQKYLDAARVTSSVAIPEIELIEKAVPAGQPVPTDRLRRFLLGLAISVLVAIGLAFAVEGIRPLASSSPIAR